MPITVAFWNINMGPTSAQAKKDAFSGWCAGHKPDLLCLEEDSFTSTVAGQAELEKLSGMHLIGSVGTLDLNDQPCGKNLVALSRTKGDFASTALRFPTFDVGEAKRMLLKVTRPASDFAVWVIHANASKKGGDVAAAAVKTHLATPAGEPCIVGGDFNHKHGGLDTWAGCPAPLAWDPDSPSLFTQWNSRGDAMPKTEADFAALMLDKAKGPIYRTIKPFNVIDYAACGKRRSLTAVASMTFDEWGAIIRTYDHAPVVYEVA